MSVFGIDFGSTYSRIATLDKKGYPEVIYNYMDGTDKLASTVYFENLKSVVVGETAEEFTEIEGDRVVRFVRNWLGQPSVEYTIDGVSYSPVDIAAKIIMRLKRMVEERGEVIKDIVAAIPPYFGFDEKADLIEVFKLADLNVISVITEPVAAVLGYYGTQEIKNKTILVYDLGGTAFDVSIVRTGFSDEEYGEKRRIRILTVDGSHTLGGMDWSERLFTHVIKLCCDENGILEEEIDEEARQILRLKTELTKKKLSSQISAKIRVNINGLMTNISVSRDEFEGMTSDLVKQTMDYVDATLNKAENIQIDEVLLVGGASQMPMIRNAIEARFPGIVQICDPDCVIAKGAAVYAGTLAEKNMGSDKDNGSVKHSKPEKKSDPESESKSEKEENKEQSDHFVLIEPVLKSYGIGVYRNDEFMIENLIRMNDKIPAQTTKTFMTFADNQETVIFRLYSDRSSEDYVSIGMNFDSYDRLSDPENDVSLLGELQLYLPQNLPKFTPIEVAFRVDLNGFCVKAVEKTNNTLIDLQFISNL